jgi:hypothetical protein
MPILRTWRFIDYLHLPAYRQDPESGYRFRRHAHKANIVCYLADIWIYNNNNNNRGYSITYPSFYKCMLTYGCALCMNARPNPRECSSSTVQEGVKVQDVGLYVLRGDHVCVPRSCLT